MLEEWMRLLKARYGSLTETENAAAWESVKENLQLGDWFEGTVIAVAPFGAWIEYPPSIRGLLLITRFRPALKPVGTREPPMLGDSLRVRVISFSEKDRVLVLSQNHKDSIF